MSVEGIGGLKWSIAPEESFDEEPKLHVMQGTKIIATVPVGGDLKQAMKVAMLLCGAPQLWSAANECVLVVANSKDGTQAENDVTTSKLSMQVVRLAEQVARCVGKASWKEVAQS